MKRRRCLGGEDIEPEKLMRGHCRFSNRMSEDTDEEVHRWSVREAVSQFEDVVASSARPDLVFDSSASGCAWLSRRIRTAREAGYRTELLWVDVPVEVALFRNRNRGVRHRSPGGGQWCREQVIFDEVEKVAASFEALRSEVDFAERLPNSKQGELDEAELDLHLYPAPRTRPPSLRPGDNGYGLSPPGARTPSPSRGSRRTLRIGPWKRNDEVMARKTKRLNWIDETYRGNRERYIREEVLCGRDVLMERNAFPYHMPPDCEHWTIWSERAMHHEELCRWVERWAEERKFTCRGRPGEVAEWNYDDNRGARTIELWHVHIYFRIRAARGSSENCSSSPCSV